MYIGVYRVVSCGMVGLLNLMLTSIFNCFLFQSELPNTANPIFPQALITVMLQVEAEQRFTAMQVLDHPWVNVSICSACESPECKRNY